MTDTVSLLRDLVALPSVNPVCRAPEGQAGERRVTEYLERFLQQIRTEQQVSGPCSSV